MSEHFITHPILEERIRLRKRRSIIKFDGGQGALLCNRCKVILRSGFDHEDREHYCDDCLYQ